MRRLLCKSGLLAPAREMRHERDFRGRNRQRRQRGFGEGRSSSNPRNNDDIGILQIKFHTIPALQVDMRAETQIESFLRSQLREDGSSMLLSTNASSLPIVRVINVPRSTLKRAVLEFHVRGIPVRALGQSTRAKRARALCFMHAARLIDHFSVEGTDSSAAPLPLEEGTELNAQKKYLKRVMSIRKTQAFGPPPQPEEYDCWEDYVDESRRHIERQEQERRNEAFQLLRIPHTGNPLVDRAAEMTEQERCTDRLALQKLNNELLGVSKGVNIVRISHRVFVATLTLDSVTNLVATGVAESSQEAKQRAAMHALNILTLVKEQRQASAVDGKASAFAGRGSCASPDAVSLSLTPRYSKMLDFFSLFFGVTPAPVFTREGNSYICHMDLDGVKCTGQGINRFEAERHAIENALGEMELYDERLQGINSIIAQYPNIQPRCVPTAKLPEALRNEIHAFVQRCRTELHFPVDGNTVGNEGHGGTPEKILTDDVLDAETRAAIKALEDVRRDEAYARRLRDRLCNLRADPKYLEKFHMRRSSLAIASVEQRILDAMDQHRVVVVCGTTGCGKTTQVPQYILDREIMEERGDRCCIVVTQPRRLSAFSIADRIASERLDVVGKDVGYAVRLDARPGRHITLCTTGVLLQMLSGMPSLDTVSHLVIDEVHERDINCDVALALVKELLMEDKNKRLKVLLMSATMQSEMFASYFGDVPVISVEGAVYPVKVCYLDHVAHLFQHSSPPGYYSPMFDALSSATTSQGRNTYRGRGGYRGTRWQLTTPPKTDYALIARLIERSVEVDLHGEVEGKSVLVFLPGWKELIAAKQALEALNGEQRYHIILLHSSVDAKKQRECFSPAPEGFVKVVLATNIAESGITIDDAAVVIDTGLIKQTSWVSRATGTQQEHHASSYSTQLALQYASRANCTQRKGRAGRTQGGICYRLFTREVWDVLPFFQEAEIHRVPLTQVLLTLLSLGHTKPKETLQRFIEPPSVKNVEASMRQLRSLGAVTADEKLTPLGLYLSRLPCDPRIGKMIMMGAVLRCMDSALTMAATADVSPFVTSREVSFEVRQKRHAFSMGSQSDHISVLNAYNAFCARQGDGVFASEQYIHRNNMRIISRYKQQYRDILRRSGFIRDGESFSLEAPEDEFIIPNDDAVAPLHVDSGLLSLDAADVTLVKACLCAALFPNVAVLDPSPLLQGGKRAKTLVMRTATHKNISPSKDSACRRLGPPRAHGVLTPKEFFGRDAESGAEAPVIPSMFYIYQSIFCVQESREEFLTQVSSVSLWALLLFGVGEADMRFDPLLQLCIVGGWIGIHIDASSFATLHALRTTLHTCVWRKYQKPDDEKNNEALEVLRRLCKEVLQSPPNDKEQYLNRLVDTGRILSPSMLEPMTTDTNDENFAWE
ncbi:ATP-dependent RNA helicase, putative [Trypanosoma cruzi]|uniref:RNA helicase n=1 Tax=Trypanosoma cruzi (strain CL Brener) TaxID=353153 RepID=Q4E322_TRYCC|nr:ATP-dependent RNA helicase, putative [Trypanosoma cruzi]EAN99155.1 ATP-dependent RNA helicase, putative [Trypanosoma cruzi]|eukprot:XP_821006.1 ATP-dependent RNA helicase [Trypanosoma cruzi strain CL Brener]